MADNVSTEGGDRFQAKKPRAKRSGFHRVQGARSMKEYPLTGPEMWQLATVGVAATVFFGGGMFLLSTWLDFMKDLAVPPDEMSAEMMGYWRAMRDASGWGTAICFVLGSVLALVNGLTIRHIINCTEHPQ